MSGDTAIEVNFDGLVGPTHNYGGLARGNVASATNQGNVSNPREAALQGLSKMRALLRMGLVQGVLPPHERPHIPSLRKMGFSGSDAEVLSAASAASPMLLANVSSAFVWAPVHVVPAQFAGLSLADLQAGDWQNAVLCAVGVVLFTTAGWFVHRRVVARAIK